MSLSERITILIWDLTSRLVRKALTILVSLSIRINLRRDITFSYFPDKFEKKIEAIMSTGNADKKSIVNDPLRYLIEIRLLSRISSAFSKKVTLKLIKMSAKKKMSNATFTVSYHAVFV
jgi:hypothetical protein